MYIFILSIIVVSFIALCFFKKRFWENRYLVLFISGCVALVATLTTNYATRNRLDTKVETIWNVPIQVMALNKAVIDSSAFTTDKELNFDDHLYGSDTTLTPIYSHHLFYYGESGLRIGFVYIDKFSNDNRKSNDWDDVYFAPSNSDSTAYVRKLRQHYANRDSKWITDFSLPHIKTIKCFYLPPAEYAAIPDSLIRELPFKI